MRQISSSQIWDVFLAGYMSPFENKFTTLLIVASFMDRYKFISLIGAIVTSSLLIPISSYLLFRTDALIVITCK